MSLLEGTPPCGWSRFQLAGQAAALAVRSATQADVSTLWSTERAVTEGFGAYAAVQEEYGVL
jgi:hypothetical protein